MEHARELARIHLVLEPLLAVDLDHWDPDAVSMFKGIVVLDVDLSELERRRLTLGLEHGTCSVAQMTTGPRIEGDAHASMLQSRAAASDLGDTTEPTCLKPI